VAIVAKSSTVWDQLEKIITVLAQLCILLMCVDVLSFRMGVLPGFIAVSGLYFMFVGCVLVCLAGFALVVCRYIASRRVGTEFILLLLLLSAPIVARLPVFGYGSMLPSYTNDVSTNIYSPPEFAYAAALRSESQNNLEAQSARYSQGLASQVAGVESLIVDMPLREAFRRASYVVALEGWTVVKEDLATGCIEAVSISPIMGFESDVVIRIVPISTNRSLIDMRSSSRDVTDDYGLNARQIQRFLSKYRAL
jgi:uncharacterized protein (DUF1499 family)